jgi:hypothetical protein
MPRDTIGRLVWCEQRGILAASKHETDLQPLYHSLRVVFGNPERLVVPLFQRPYVWTQEQQWEPLWADVRTVAERVVAGAGPSGKVKGHFLGSVVLEQRKNAPGTLPCRHVIDGQQRLTTLQILLRAASHAMADAAAALLSDPTTGQPRRTAAFIAQQVAALTVNANVMEGEEAYKVWPTNDDRDAFRLVMDAATPDAMAPSQHRLQEAFRYFLGAVRTYLAGDDGSRIRALGSALQDHLRLIIMSLDEEDEPQAIFETLNARGTPLLPTDLIKNWLLWTAQRNGEGVDALYTEHWAPFDRDSYWRERIGTGHASRARADAFLVNWLTERTREAVPVKRVYEAFLAYVTSRDVRARSAGDWMEEIKAASVLYRRIEQPGTGGDRFTTFLRRLRALDVATLYPFLLHVMARPGSDAADLDAMGELLESYLLRRVICGSNTRGYGAAFLRLIEEIAKVGLQEPGAPTLKAFLSHGFGDALRWPGDADFQHSLVHERLYGRRGQRPHLVLGALEEARRSASAKTPAVPLPPLQVEHVMPVGWRSHWPLPSAADAAAAARDHAIHTLGNLTLVTGPLNASMKHAPWTDPTPGIGKRDALQAHDVLFLNRDIVNDASGLRAAWDEFSIAARAADLAVRALKIWPGPLPPPAPVAKAAP